jgi:hypothetical protein
MLNAAEAPDAIEVVVEGVRGGDIVIQGDVFIIFQHFGQMGGIDAGKGDILYSLPFLLWAKYSPELCIWQSIDWASKWGLKEI